MDRVLYEFGNYVLDLEAYELRRDGIPVELAAQALSVLVFLVRNQARVVSREELFAAVWPGVIVNDGSLTQAIWQIRSALGDDPRKPSSVKTVRRRGYRFVATLVEPEAALDEKLTPRGGAELMGRERELRRLRAALREAAAGSGRVCLLRGARGVGKTSLARALTEEARESGLLTLWGQALEEPEPCPPLWPFVQMLEHHLMSDREQLSKLFLSAAPVGCQLLPSMQKEVGIGPSSAGERFLQQDELARLFAQLSTEAGALLYAKTCSGPTKHASGSWLGLHN